MFLFQRERRFILTRIPRYYSPSKVYHIILKGIDNQNIFYDDLDRNIFLKHLLKTKKDFNLNLYAFCLMDNHVHIVLKSEKVFLSKSMQSLTIRYVQYFNKKYKRTGTLVQSRFRSKSIEDQRYFLEVCRYVHRNPENAGIARTEDYQWSSYQEYLGKSKIIDKSVLLHYFDNNVADFVNFTIKNNSYEYLNELAEYELISKLTDRQVEDIIAKFFHIHNINQIPYFFKNQDKVLFNESILKLKMIKGTNKTQLARIIRVHRSIIEKIWNI